MDELSQVLDPAVEVRPSAQSVQELAPADEYEFARQSSHAVEPVIASYWPLGQDAHAAWLLTEYFPALQETHAVDPSGA